MAVIIIYIFNSIFRFLETSEAVVNLLIVWRNYTRLSL